MSGRWDVIVVGAGHNGLAAAAYLAKGGCSVLLLERAARAGGSAATVEFAPGFRASGAFQSAETLSPRVIKELGLKAHGLELARPGGLTLATPDGLLRTDGKGRAASGALLSDGDARRLREVERFVAKLVGALAPLYEAPLPELESLDAGGKLDLLRIGWRLRRLGRRDMEEAMRSVPMSMRDFAEDRLEGEAARALLAGTGSPGGFLGPWAAGTVLRALHDQMSNPRPLLAGPMLPRGGMGALADALAAAARAMGAELRHEAGVESIDSDDGAVRGVTLASGEHLEADIVLSDAAPRTTLLELVDPAALEPEFLFAARGIRARAGVALVSFGLDALPALPGGADAPAGRIQLGARLADIERAFDGVPAGRLPERPFVQLLFPSVGDAELAAGGRHVATAWVQAVPRRISVGAAPGGAPEYGATDGWEDGREQLARAVVRVIEEVMPGFSDRIVAHHVSAPPDFEADFGASDGCLYDADLGLDQALFLRPLAGWYGYRTPLRGLYLCSAGSHAGGGITALAGRNAAQRVLADRKAAGGKG